MQYTLNFQLFRGFPWPTLRAEVRIWAGRRQATRAGHERQATHLPHRHGPSSLLNEWGGGRVGKWSPSLQNERVVEGQNPCLLNRRQGGRRAWPSSLLNGGNSSIPAERREVQGASCSDEWREGGGGSMGHCMNGGSNRWSSCLLNEVKELVSFGKSCYCKSKQALISCWLMMG